MRNRYKTINTSFNNFCVIVISVLLVLAFGVRAENADQTVSEISPAPVEVKVETETKVEKKPEPKADSEEALPDRVFRPSEQISEDIVIAFPVDI